MAGGRCWVLGCGFLVLGYGFWADLVVVLVLGCVGCLGREGPGGLSAESWFRISCFGFRVSDLSAWAVIHRMSLGVAPKQGGCVRWCVC